MNNKCKALLKQAEIVPGPEWDKPVTPPPVGAIFYEEDEPIPISNNVAWVFNKLSRDNETDT